jgi:anaerobic ribonucleoside-triphosphate reductase activating protein
MNIVSTQFTLKYNALEIYVSGCYGNCNGCHNTELKDFNIGENYIDSLYKIIGKIKTFDFIIDKVWILGGEPLDQNINELLDLLQRLKSTNKEIWLFTRYELEEIDKRIIELCDYIKTGKFIKELKSDDIEMYGVKLATTNQKINKISK